MTSAPTSSKTPPRSRRPLALIGAALAACALLAAGVVFYLQTPDGTLRIEINDPAIEVFVNKAGAVIKGADKHDITLTPGPHLLQVKRGDDFTFDTDKFIIKKGETITLKVEWLKDGKLQVVQGDRVIGEKAPKTTVAAVPVRSAASFALRFEGKAKVDVPGLKLPQEGDFTVEAWVTPGPINAESHFQVVAFPNCYLHVMSDGSCQFSLYRDKSGEFAQARWLKSGTKVHIAAERKGDEIRLYLDGKLKGSKTVGKFALPSSAGSASFGANNPKCLASGHILGPIHISRTARYDNSFVPPQRFDADADTLALYRFDEGQGDLLKDSSGNGHDGKIVGAKWVKAEPSKPPMKYALEFDGKSSYVDLPSLTYDGSHPITIEAVAEFAPQKSRVSALVSNLHCNGSFCAILARNRNWPSFGIVTNDRHSYAEIQKDYDGISRIAGVWDGKKVSIFANGKYGGSWEFSPATAENKLASFFVLGANHGKDGKGKQAFYPGKLYEVRISKIARYQGDYLPASILTGDKDTLALYHFDEGQGDILKDSSGNGHHGKIVGAKWVRPRSTAIAWTPLVPTKQDLANLKSVKISDGAIELRDEALVFGSVTATDQRVRAKATFHPPGNLSLRVREGAGGGYAAWYNEFGGVGIGKSVTINGKLQWINLEMLNSNSKFGDVFDMSFSASGDMLELAINDKVLVRLRDKTYTFGSPGIGVVAGRGEFRAVEFSGQVDGAIPQISWTPRSIAEWTIRRGGKVWIGDTSVGKIADLPADNFNLARVIINGIPLDAKDLATINSWHGVKIGDLDLEGASLTDEGLRLLAKGGADFQGLAVGNNPISGSGFDAWQDRPISVLSLADCPINPDGWLAIAKIKAPLRDLWLIGCPLTDSAVAEIARRHPGLQGLWADRTRLTDQALMDLQYLTQLKALDLSHTAVTDAGVPNLAKLSKLVYLNLAGTKATDKTVDALRKALPNCKIVR